MLNFKWIFVVVLMALVSCTDEAPVVLWEDVVDSAGNLDEVVMLETAPDGNIVLLGHRGWGENIILSKYNQSGTLMFSYVTDPTGDFEYPRDMAIDKSDGSIYVATYNGFAKYSKRGLLLWYRDCEDVVDNGYVIGVEIIGDKVFTAGTAFSSYTKSGELISTKKLPFEGKRLYQTPDENLLVLGFNNLHKIAPDGSLVWEIQNNDFRAEALDQNYAGYIYVTGNVTSDYTITAKISPGGQIIWIKEHHFSDVNTIMEVDQRIKVGANGNVYIVFYAVIKRPYATDALVTVKYNSDGEELWSVHKRGFYSLPPGVVLPAPDIAVDAYERVFVTANSKLIEWSKEGKELMRFDDGSIESNYVTIDSWNFPYLTTVVDKSIKVWKFDKIELD
jgi:outer membrane protein assembly factor BamB